MAGRSVPPLVFCAAVLMALPVASADVMQAMEGPADDLELELVVAGGLLDSPVVITNAGDDSNRLFIVEQEGIIRIVDLATSTLLPTPFLNISAVVHDSGFEQGLLGLAFHPDYGTNRQFYVNYTYDPVGSNPDRTRIAMYRASEGNANIANTTETVILEFTQTATNHNGGDMHFDSDGYLVIASGDGGGAPGTRPQDLSLLLGKILRIDVDTPPSIEAGSELCGLVQNYSIPPDNPYAAGDGACDEILHYGLRNPWRFSLDARTGEMYIGDVGQGEWEEVDRAGAGEYGLNFGWPACEGGHEYPPNGELCDVAEFTNPVIEYSSGSGSGNCSVTGGYVYRGGNRNLQGRYVYADFCSARIWIATRQGETWVSEEWVEDPPLGTIATFGQDEHCELYVANQGGGGVHRIVSSEILDSSGFETLRCQ